MIYQSMYLIHSNIFKIPRIQLKITRITMNSLENCLIILLFINRLEILENIYSLLFLKYENLTIDNSDVEEGRSIQYTR